MGDLEEKADRAVKVGAAGWAIFQRIRAWKKARDERQAKERFERALAKLVEVTGDARRSIEAALERSDEVRKATERGRTRCHNGRGRTRCELNVGHEGPHKQGDTSWSK